MDAFNQHVSWYQQKIGAYDKQRWETSVEEKVLKNLENAPKKTAKVKSELIDVDLVRGSTFSKAKPQHGWLALAWKGISRVLFLPIYLKWWKKQTNGWFAAFIFVLYVLQLGTTILYMMDTSEGLKIENLSIAHVVNPLLVMMFLGVLHAQIIATNLSTRKPSHQQRPKAKRRITKSRRKKPTGRYRASSTERGSASYDGEMYGETYQASNRAADNPGEGSSNGIQNPGVQIRQSRARLASNLESSGVEVDESSKDPDFDTTTDSPPSSRDESEEGRPRTRGFSYRNVDGLSHISGKAGENVLDLNMPIPEPTGHLFTTDSVIQDIAEGTPKQAEAFADQTRTHYIGGHSEASMSLNQPYTDCDPTSSNVYATVDKNINDVESQHDQDVYIARENSLSTETLKAADLASQMASASTLRNRMSQKSGKASMQGYRKSGSRLSVRVTDINKESTGMSSCESDTELALPSQIGKKASLRGRFRRSDRSSDMESPISEMEWEDGMQTGGSTTTGTSDSDAGGCTSATSISDDQNDREDRDQENPFCNVPCTSVPSAVNHLASGSDKVSCMIWEGSEVSKVDLSVLDIGWTIIKKVDLKSERCNYVVIGVLFSAVMALIPLLYRLYHIQGNVDVLSLSGIFQILPALCGHDWKLLVVILNGVIQRLSLGLTFFFLLTVAERTFKQRLQYAKHFCYLTSSRRAKKYELPHFRLNKVRNIKTWLSLRSYLKKRGPQRSVHTIVSASFLLAVLLGSLMCIELLRDSGKFLDYLGNWELVAWSMALGTYLLRFMTLGTKINKKYRNFSVLITEQINLYLHMEKKPHKKEELMLANSVLKLAEALLKELESPFKISGLSANPFLYNITKVVILSAFSGVLTELLGFKLKLYKIKLRT